MIDPERVKGFAKQLVSLYSGGGLTLMIDLGGRTGLFDSLAEGPGTSDEIVMHCLQVSLAGGGAGLGAAWGEQKAREMLTEAGFSRIDTARPPMDPFNLVYVCRS